MASIIPGDGGLTGSGSGDRVLCDFMPHVSVNLAISADGKISSAKRQPSGWTSKADFERFIELRKPADALLVGRGTLESDQMTMTVPGAARQPLRCIVSRKGVLDPAHPIFSREGGEIHLLVTSEAAVEVPAGVTVHRGEIEGFLDALEKNHGVRHVHCEGGGELVKALAEADLIDVMHLTWAGHTIFGGLAAPTATGVPGEFLTASRHFELTTFDPRPELGECFLTWERIR